MGSSTKYGVDLDEALIRQLSGALRRHWFLILFVFMVGVVAVYGTLSLLGEEYEAEARLIVKLGRENTEVPITVEKGGVYVTGVQKEEVNSYIQFLMSRSLVMAAVDRVGLDRFEFSPPPPQTLFQKLKYELKRVMRWCRTQISELMIWLDLKKRLDDREKVLKMVGDSLVVVRERDSNVIRLLLQLPSGELAADVLSEMLAVFFQHHTKIWSEDQAQNVFALQAGEYDRQLQEIQARLLKIKDKWHISSAPEQRVQLLGRLHGLKQQMEIDRGERASLAKRRDMLRERLYRFDERAGKGGSGAAVPEYLAPNLLLEFEAELERVEVSLAGLSASLQEQGNNAANLEYELRKLNVGEDRLRTGELQHRVVEERFLTYARRREEAGVAQELDRLRIANVRVFTPPLAGPEPVAPRKKLVMGVGAAFALLMGVVLALIIEWRRDTVHDAVDLAGIEGLPFLGVYHLENRRT